MILHSRRHMQSIMIEGDLIRWLSQLLSDHDNLSDYTLEYSVALLMNLCLRSAGKRRCLRDAGHILRIMSDLLGHENQEIRPYVNGTLYSILALPAVKEEARALGMEEILNCFLKDDNPDMTRQIQFIIQQLNSDDPSATNEPESDDEDEDEDDDEGDAIDADLDKQEVLEPKDGELCGDELLSLHYSLNSISSGRPKSKKRILGDVDPNHPLTRPTTPGTRGADAAAQGIAAKETSLQPTTAAISRAPQQQRDLQVLERPKIPRTPDSRPRTSTPPPLGRSTSPTRPTSKDERLGLSNYGRKSTSR
ncbi:LisH domain-containing protein ARMC9 [Acropora cervicornis]|uniref:LisH domain-containing protein ARMC9 n=1 Tax=Acropora cervicornis TaxID=6130 RepID=A0AAD9Q1B4_ACRCE|nr:LisH domain-containing protein ARMC9 [Acropora cervicornis]